jgi:hypothetical protein
MTNFRAVLFDWRGTLALTLSGPQWIQEGFRRTGRKASDEAAQGVLDKITSAPSWSKAGVAGPYAAALSPDDAT